MAKFGDSGELLKCSFCGKSQKQVKKLIAGPGVYICDECIDLCNEIIEEELAESSELRFDELPKPREIYTFLNDYVVGQEPAKKILSVAVYNHYKRIQFGQHHGPGPPRRRRAGQVEHPAARPHRLRQDAAGPDAGPHAERALRHRRRHRAHRGRLRGRGRREHPPQAHPGRGLRRQEGRDGHHLHRRDRQDRPQEREPVDHPGRVGRGRAAGAAEDPGGHHRLGAAAGGRKHPHQEFIQIDTTNILFICGGAFAGLDKIIESRIGHKGVGFGATIRSKQEKDMGELLVQVLPEDLLKFGLIPEFVGRLPVIGAVSNLDRDALVEILVEPKNALVKQYRKFFEFEEVELEFTEDALEAVAEQALLRGTGARGLRAILEEVLLNVMYDLPGRSDIGRCVIDGDTVLRKVNPTLIPRESTRSQRPRRAASASCGSAPPTPRGMAMHPGAQADHHAGQAGRRHGGSGRWSRTASSTSARTGWPSALRLGPAPRRPRRHLRREPPSSSSRWCGPRSARGSTSPRSTATSRPRRPRTSSTTARPRRSVASLQVTRVGEPAPGAALGLSGAARPRSGDDPGLRRLRGRCWPSLARAARRASRRASSCSIRAAPPGGRRASSGPLGGLMIDDPLRDAARAIELFDIRRTPSTSRPRRSTTRPHSASPRASPRARRHRRW